MIVRDLGEDRACISIVNDGEPVTEEQLENIRACMDDGVSGGDDARRHIGLNNIRSRLRFYYPEEDCGLFFRPAEGGGLAVDVIIAKHCAADAQEGGSC